MGKDINIKTYRNIIVPVALYGCETWSVMLREEHRLRVSGNKVLREIFGAKRQGCDIGPKKLNDSYCSCT